MNPRAARRRRRCFAVAAAGAFLALGLASASTSAVPRETPRGSSYDRNANGVYDALERQIEAGPSASGVRVLVSLARPATQERVAALAAGHGLQSVRRFAAVDGFAATLPAERVAGLARAPGVVHVEADSAVLAFDASANDSFGVAKARLDSPGLDGSGVVVAVVDTGIDTAHHDLDGGTVIGFADCDPLPCITESAGDAFDDNGHGTYVAGILAGDKGVAPAASLVGVKVLDAVGGPAVGGKERMIAGIQWIIVHRADYGIDVLNLSIGIPSSGPLGEGCSDGTDLLSQAANAAAAAGMLVVAAAGNSGPAPCSVGSPAAADGALTVGSMADLSGAGEVDNRPILGFRLSWLSSRGPTADGRTKPDVVAPGVEVTSAKAGTLDDHRDATGSSAAAPFVAGVAALLEEANPGLDSAAIRSIIQNSAIDWGAGGRDNEYGAGRVDAYAAIAAASGSISSPPAVPLHQGWSGHLSGSGDRADYDLNVTDTGYPIAATLIVPAGSNAVDSPNLDFELRGPSGAVVASATQIPGMTASAGWPVLSGRQEDLGYGPTVSGHYMLSVIEVAGPPADYVLDVSRGPAPPVNQVPPSVAGTPVDGAELQASSGTWGGTLPLVETYEWLRCGSDGAHCLILGGETGTGYTLEADDIGATIRVRVTATNDGGAGSMASAPTAVVEAAPPVNTSAPVITGLLQDGAKLKVSVGDWSGTAPFDFLYAWYRCSAADCLAIHGANGSAYTLTGSDVGKSIYALVTAENAAGTQAASSEETALVEPEAPQNISPPTLSGTARDELTLKVSTGDWLGTAPLDFAFQWQRAAGLDPWADIDGATGFSYTLTPADVGAWVRARVTASNLGGEEPVFSDPTEPVAAAGPANVSPPAINGIARAGETLSVDAGLWHGTPPLAFAFEWQRSSDGLVWSSIAGAGAAAYRVTSDDVGKRVRVRVAASNATGMDAEASSSPTGQVAPAPPIMGTRGPDILKGTWDDDRLFGMGGNDVIRALGGDDTLWGGAGADRLYGGAGSDRLDGGPGSDRLFGGSGNDRLTTRDGRRDYVNCGGGADVAVVDRFDVVAGCEKIRRR